MHREMRFFFSCTTLCLPLCVYVGCILLKLDIIWSYKADFGILRNKYSLGSLSAETPQTFSSTLSVT